LSEHLSSERIASLLEGRLSRRDTRSILARLVHDRDQPPHPDAYDRALASAVAAAEARQREWRAAERWLTFYIASGRKAFFQYKPARKRRIASRGLCDLLLRLSHALRKDFPEEMVHFAEIAVEVAELAPWPPFGIERARDLEARSWAELANAYRVADDLPQARAAMARAYKKLCVGTLDPLLLARLDDLQASLFAAQRQFKEALRSIRSARAIYLRTGDWHLAGRALIKIGFFFGNAGRPEAGIKWIAQGLQEIDRDRDPDLVFRGLENVIFFSMSKGDHEEAWDFLSQLKPLSTVLAGEVDRIKLIGLEGQLAAAAGELDHAEQAFLKAKEALEERGLVFHAASAGLDLAAVWCRQGRTAEVRGLVVKLVQTFSRLEVEREAIAALLLLHQAAVRDRATLELIEQAGAAVQRLAKRQPRPDRPRPRRRDS
jgi:tetratricopeptide (TPR) repeat protein